MPPTPPNSQPTDFSLDVLGRYICNGLDEALRTVDTNVRPDARPFDVIVIGGGTFGAALAQHIFSQDKTHSHRVLVLEAGPVVLPEHVQNLPMLGLNPPPASSIADLRAAGLKDGQARAEVWGLPWHSDVPQGFPGLAYCVGGRSLFWGGWSPQPIDTELATEWPSVVVNDLNSRYYPEASEQLGVTETNDFISGALHEAMRQQLANGMDQITDVVALADLPLHLNVPVAMAAGAGAARATAGSSAPASTDVLKLEAPLAVQSRATRAGVFPTNKFSATPLLMKASRSAFSESNGDDFKKRLMVVPNCHVKGIAPGQTASGWRADRIDTNFGAIPVSPNAIVVIAQGTIESTRQTLLFLNNIPPASRPNLPAGRRLMAHLRSNLDVRIPRQALVNLDPAIKELQVSALFIKGRHQFADGSFGHYHLQITASGLGSAGTDSEAELFKKIPDIDGFDVFKNATDTHVVITIRGIGEMQPQNPNSFVSLDAEPDEYGVQRSFVRITPSAKDNELWNVMDKAAMDTAKVFAGGQTLEILGQRRDGLGTTHHESGPLWMGANGGASVTDTDCKLHGIDNIYAAGPALFPRMGSPNPTLTGIALARRLGNKLAAGPTVSVEPGFRALFDGSSTANWRMAPIKKQPGRDNPGTVLIVDGALELSPGTDIGLFYCTTPTPPDFILKLEWLRWQQDANSGVFIRFPDPTSKGYNNAAFVGVDFGFEVQIDELGAPDGAGVHKTGAIYSQPSQTLTQQPARPVGQWNEYEIRVQGQSYTVLLNGAQVTQFTNTQSGRGLPSTATAPSYIGLQTHTGRVAFRNIRIRAI